MTSSSDDIIKIIDFIDTELEQLMNKLFVPVSDPEKLIEAKNIELIHSLLGNTNEDNHHANPKESSSDIFKTNHILSSSEVLLLKEKIALLNDLKSTDPIVK